MTDSKDKPAAWYIGERRFERSNHVKFQSPASGNAICAACWIPIRRGETFVREDQPKGAKRWHVDCAVTAGVVREVK